ncbi:MAG: hypothetical protein LBE91_09090 [Tannerella sp.]|jgi:hypothetical protein|nr:hypothetical protein [Tannerella sp.]
MKRKNVILSALFILLSAGALWAQEQKPYKPAATFDGDTLQYLEYNYTKRSDQYIGKTVGEVLKELEYPVLYIVEGHYLLMPGGRSARVVGLSLGIRQMDKEPSPLKDYYIVISYENPPTFEEYREARSDTEENRNPVFFSRKLFDLIKGLKVLDISFNPYAFKDPELVKMRKQAEKDGLTKPPSDYKERLKRLKLFDDLKAAEELEEVLKTERGAKKMTEKE